MNQNFYHWQTRAGFTPDVSILEPRWNAAAKFVKKPSPGDILSLLRLILFPGAEPEFAKRFSEALVREEPTFPPDKNAQLLRVMAAAGVHSLFEKPSSVADALALGLQSAAYPDGRIAPICADVMIRSAEYLDGESERLRPEIDAGVLEETEKQTEGHLAALKQAVEANTPSEVGKATAALGRGVIAAIKESHKQLGGVIGRLTEESQFLWWLIGRRSPSLKRRREQLSGKEYAFPAAAEAAERVNLLPPPASVPSLIDEVLSQCKGGNAQALLSDLVGSADVDWLQAEVSIPPAPELTPLAALLAERKANRKLSAAALKKIRILAKTKATTVEVSRQYFKELMFLRAIEELN